MKEQEINIQFPVKLDTEDRLFLEMAVVDDDVEEASRLVGAYGIEIPDGSNPLGLCRNWIAGIKKAEKRHCQNVIDLHSQGKSIGGMQALATSTRKEA